MIEIGHGARNERHRTYDACAGEEKELVVDEVKGDLKGISPRGDWSRGHAARCDIERGLPPVVDVGMKFELDLAYDLHPHMYCAVCILPLLQRQRGPELLAFSLAEWWKWCPGHVYLLWKQTIQLAGAPLLYRRLLPSYKISRRRPPLDIMRSFYHIF